MSWTETTRAEYQREGLRYAGDATEEEWAVIEPFMPPVQKRGRPCTTDLRAVVNVIFSVAQSGCRWRMRPKDLPSYTTVQRCFCSWRDGGLWQQINRHRLMDAREVAKADRVLV